MKFDELINSHLSFGTQKEDIIKRRGYEKILKNVVVAPWWSHNIFEKFGATIDKVGDNIFNVCGKDFQFSFIEIQNIGAPSILEAVLPLGVTQCEKIIFIGSVGSLDENIKIGDLVVPSCSISGVGATRFLSKTLEDDFEKEYFPHKKLTENAVELIIEKYSQFDVHHCKNYSVDTIFAQFPHIEHFVKLGAKTIEMETSALFKCCNMIEVPCCAILCVSDSSLKNKSLFSGRTDDEKVKRRKMRDEIIPQIVIDLFNR